MSNNHHVVCCRVIMLQYNDLIINNCLRDLSTLAASMLGQTPIIASDVMLAMGTRSFVDL
jgi:hypothetical protein